MLSRFTLPLTLFVSETWSWTTDDIIVDSDVSNLKFSSNALATIATLDPLNGYVYT
jgi:hypothetical protein